MILRDLLVRTGMRASKSMERLTKILRLKRSGARQLELVSMEDRLLFSAAPGPMPVAPAPDAQIEMVVAASLTAPVEIFSDASLSQNSESTMEAQGLQPLGVLSETTGGVLQATSYELVFIDTGVENYQALLDDIWSHQDPQRHIDVVLLSANESGITQITETLAQYQTEKLDAVHFVTHGADRAIKLGDTWLDAAALEANRDHIASWGEALKPGADLLIYGCDLAGNDLGRALLNNLVDLTGADVAASIDDTGSKLLGGNWDLEYTIGDIETDVAISEFTQVEWTGLLNTFTVTNTNDSGAGSFRQAIDDANLLAGVDTIGFNITGGGPHSIGLLSALPGITDTVVIDGWSEPDYAGTPIIEINAGGANSGIDLLVGSDGSTVRGLSLHSFTGTAMEIYSSNNIIQGNYIGTDATGIASGLGNTGNGIAVVSGSGNKIGGDTAQERNVIVGNSGPGVSLVNSGTIGTIVTGNYIGIGADGTALIGNLGAGVSLSNGANGNLIGGSGAGEGNVISGNTGDGIEFIIFAGSNNNTIQGNWIGTLSNG